MPAPLAKICGIKDQESLDVCITFGARYIGFVHYARSPRHIEPKEAAKLAATLPSSVKSVSVIVDKLPDEVDAYLREFTPDFLQLHGNESIDYVKSLREKLPSKIGLIKAISVKSGDDIAKAYAFEPHVDMLMFDAKAPTGGLPGGNGLRFDWALLKNRRFENAWLLSGGLDADNVQEAIRMSGAKIVDISSSVESAPGVKDPKRIEAFLTCLKNIAL